jgi:hypothetical protein
MTLDAPVNTHTLSMYEQAMGERYARLGDALQRFHRLAGRQVLLGQVETQAPASWPARALAFCLGSPRQALAGPIRFELDADPDTETWTRHFPNRTMSSRLRLESGSIVERLGPVRLSFDLQEHEGRLRMHLQRLHVLGIPCPAFLMPRVVAEETGVGDRLQFNVQAALPLVGVVAGYRGHLVIPHEGRP